jgi:hypothetical protein
MAQRVRRQHVVSQFYLKGFANDASRVKRLGLPGTDEIVMTTSDATVIKDYYTVELPDGTRSDMFERFFSQFEGDAAEAIRSVSSGSWPLGDEQRTALARWVALQYLRGEEIRNSHGALGGLHIRLLVGTSGKAALRALIEQREGAPISDFDLDWEWNDLTKPGGPNIETDPEEHLAFLMDLLPNLAAHLDSWHWNLFQFERKALGTADHPVSLIARSDHPVGHGVGIATAGLFYVPLTRRHGLTMQPRDAFPAHLGFVPDQRHAGTTQVANTLNQQAARSARRFVYCHPDDAPFASPVVLPEPSAHSWSDSGADRMIFEEGLFGGLSDDAMHAMASPSMGDDRGMTLGDLPWPIPGRVGQRPSDGTDDVDGGSDDRDAGEAGGPQET